MATKELLLSNFGSFKEVMVVDEERPKDLLIKTLEDCESILERAKVLSELTPGKDFRHVAIIPRHVLDQSMREGWFNDRERWKRWANNPDNRGFRTWPGQL